MEIRIKKSQEGKKGGFMSEKNTKCTLEISAILTDDENKRIQKYYDPSLSSITVIPKYYEGSTEQYKEVKINTDGYNLSNYRLVAHVDNGNDYLGNLQAFEKAVVRALTSSLHDLKGMAAWEGDQTLTVE